MDLLDDVFWSCGSPPESIPLVAAELPSLEHSSPRAHIAAADTTVFSDFSLFEMDDIEFLPFDEMENELRTLDETSMKSNVSSLNLETSPAQNVDLASNKILIENELLKENSGAQVHKICAKRQVAAEFSLDAIDSIYGADDINCSTKMHECGICSRNFTKLDGLNSHYQTCYMNLIAEGNKTNNLISPEEEISINAMDDLSLENSDFSLGEAMESIHGSEVNCFTKMHKCCMCSRIFPRLDELNAHYQACFRNLNTEEVETSHLTLEEEISINIADIMPDTGCSTIKPYRTERYTKLETNEKSTPTETVQPEIEVYCPINYPNNFISELGQFMNIPSQTSPTTKNYLKFKRSLKTVYECSICSETFAQKHPLMCHMQKHTCMEPPNTSPCSPHSVKHSKSSKLRLAGQQSTPSHTWSTVPLLPSHESGKQPKDKVGTFPCLLCNRKYSRKSSLEVHQRVHSGRKPYACGTCPFSCSQETNLIRHLRTHFKNGFLKSFTCTVCGRVFNTNRGLGIHCSLHRKRRVKITPLEALINITQADNTSSKFQTVFTNEVNNTPKTESTEIINDFQETTTSPSNLLEMKEKSKSQSELKASYTCSVCSKNFRYKSLLNNHFLTHTKERSLKCVFCQKSFIKALELKYHMENHGKAMPHPCAGCDKGFFCLSDLQSHIPKCKKDLRWLCAYCGTIFRLKTQLIVHERIHKKPYSCKICNFTCSQGTNMKRHNKTHLGSLKPFVCASSRCNRKFATEDELKVHYTQKERRKANAVSKYLKTVFNAENKSSDFKADCIPIAEANETTFKGETGEVC